MTSVDYGGGDHEPDDAGGGELLDEVFGGGGAGAAGLGEGVDGGLVAVEADALVAGFDEALTMFMPIRPRPTIPSCICRGSP